MCISIQYEIVKELEDLTGANIPQVLRPRLCHNLITRTLGPYAALAFSFIFIYFRSPGGLPVDWIKSIVEIRENTSR